MGDRGTHAGRARTCVPRGFRGRLVAGRALLAALLAALAVCAMVPGCAPTAPAPHQPGVVRVVAAENFWGSIASQLGGSHARVVSIVNNPNTDPHDYEPTIQDARTISAADLVISNGVGYDPWVGRVLAANPNPQRRDLDVGKLVGVSAGGNPHRWYSPADVRKVADQTTADYKTLDPVDADYFEQQQRTFETVSLAKYDGLVAGIKAKYAGTPIGASESIVAPLADALGLKLLTPPTFLDAISEGTDPTAADKAAVDAQIKARQIKILIYNRQNSTPDVMALVSEARAQGIPVVTVTETLDPASATFQDWQSAQLESIQRALGTATGR